MDNTERVLGFDLSNGKDFTCFVVGKIENNRVVYIGSFDIERKALRFISRNKQHLQLVVG